MTFPSQLWAMTPMSMGYINKVLKPNSSIGYDPSSLIGFWPQNEKSGLVSIDHSGLGHHGAYQGVDLGRPGVPGMGMTSPFYDGINDFNNLYTAGFANDNLMLNSGFETPGAIWANWTEIPGDGALTNEVVIVHEGADACKMTSGLTSNTRVYQAITVVPGEKYRTRIWTQGDGANGGHYRIYDNTNIREITAKTPTGVTAAAWGMFSIEWTAPAGCISAWVMLYCPTVNAAVCYYDATETRRTDGFLGDKGTIIVPAQVANVGVWTDGQFRRLIQIAVDPNNELRILRSSVNNRIYCHYEAGGVALFINVDTAGPLGWPFWGVTWDINADELIFYLDGLQQGLTVNGLGTWVGDLAANGVVIGAETTVPANVWHGNEGPVLLYNEAKTPAEIAYLSTP